MPQPSSDELDAIDRKLAKRGFRRIDVYLHQCTACNEQAVLKYGTMGRTGGRDIALCQACGSATSWRSVAGLEAREQDLAFDLGAFLG
jgi:transcription elongation factor Elf1